MTLFIYAVTHLYTLKYDLAWDCHPERVNKFQLSDNRIVSGVSLLLEKTPNSFRTKVFNRCNWTTTGGWNVADFTCPMKTPIPKVMQQESTEITSRVRVCSLWAQQCGGKMMIVHTQRSCCDSDVRDDRFFVVLILFDVAYFRKKGYQRNDWMGISSHTIRTLLGPQLLVWLDIFHHCYVIKIWGKTEIFRSNLCNGVKLQENAAISGAPPTQSPMASTSRCGFWFCWWNIWSRPRYLMSLSSSQAQEQNCTQKKKDWQKRWTLLDLVRGGGENFCLDQQQTPKNPNSI